MKASFQLVLVILATLTISGCGFHLRGNQALPSSIDYVAVTSAQAHAPLARALTERLHVYDINGGMLSNSDSPDHSVVLVLKPEQLERRLLSVFSTGQVAEYELIYGVNYQVVFPGREPLNAYFEVLRDYQDDPDQVLAKSRELNLVLKEMRKDAADTIIRRLASQRAETVPVQ